MAKRSYELAQELMRRAEAAAARRQEALEAERNGEGERAGGNPFTDPAHLAREEAKQDAARERLFGPVPAETEQPTKPEGSANGGEGEAEEHEYEDVQTESGMQRMRVFDLDELTDRKDD